MPIITVTELRKSPKKYVGQANLGQVLIITDNGIPVAILAPLPDNFEPYYRTLLRGKTMELIVKPQEGPEA